MVTFDHVDFAFQKTKTTCMVADLKIATPKHANSDTRVCSFLAQVPPSEARFASGASQPRSPGPQKRETWYKLVELAIFSPYYAS
jgi:hypothetical protein